MNTLRNFEMKVAAAMMTAGLAAGAASAGVVVDVTLPDNVVGSGQPTIDQTPEGSPLLSTFVFRGGNGETSAVVPRPKSAEVFPSPDNELTDAK